MIKTDEGGSSKNRPFRFIKAWIEDQSSFEMVRSAWETRAQRGGEAPKIVKSLAATSQALRKWNKTHFGYPHDWITNIEQKLTKLHKSICFDHS